jgi:hypothetical protein
MPSTEGGARGLERSLRTMKAEMRTRPQAEVAEYISKVKEQLGVYPGQVWNLLELDRRIASGRNKKHCNGFTSSLRK